MLFRMFNLVRFKCSLWGVIAIVQSDIVSVWSDYYSAVYNIITVPLYYNICLVDTGAIDSKTVIGMLTTSKWSF